MTFDFWPFARRPKIRPPRAVITGPSFAFAGDVVSFGGSSSTGDIIHWRFGFEEGVTAWDQPNVTYVFTNPGLRIVSLVVIGPSGLVSEASHQIKISEKNT